MRTLLLTIALVALPSMALRAQSVPPVQRMPTDTGHPAPTMHIHENTRIPYALIVDSMMLWSGNETTHDWSDSTYAALFKQLTPEDIADVTVLKGPTAKARGACGGALLVITTNSGKWLPPAGNWTARVPLTCTGVAP
jgi:hypothetical protein